MLRFRCLRFNDDGVKMQMNSQRTEVTAYGQVAAKEAPLSRTPRATERRRARRGKREWTEQRHTESELIRARDLKRDTAKMIDQCQREKGDIRLIRARGNGEGTGRGSDEKEKGNGRAKEPNEGWREENISISHRKEAKDRQILQQKCHRPIDRKFKRLWVNRTPAIASVHRSDRG